MAVIETKNLKKIYNQGSDIEVRAVDGVSVKIDKGEFTAIVGASGSGKTTLLNLIGGLDQPTAGDVIINGKNIANLSENEMIDFRLNNIGFVFQSYNLIPVLNSIENVEFIMLMQNKPKEERDQRAKELLQSVGLEKELLKKPSKLSGGQQQRVAVARALASKPQFVLADEPTANLDSSATNELLDIMYQLNKNEAMTFVFATHDQRVIDRAKRVITIDDGKVISDTKSVQKKD
jgi:putative ABC transport system ATP-binding protein